MSDECANPGCVRQRQWSARDSEIIANMQAERDGLNVLVADILDRCFPGGWPHGADEVWQRAVKAGVRANRTPTEGVAQ